MKNAPRVNTNKYILYQLNDLLAHLETELEFAVSCYEDGTLSPRRSFQYIKDKLESVTDLINTEEFPYNLSSVENQSNTLPPPATPESL